MSKTEFVTGLEREVLKNIINSEYMNAEREGMINFPVWSFTATNETKQLTGALGSLVKKGFVCSDNNGSDDPCCFLTADGYAWCKNNGLA